MNCVVIILMNNVYSVNFQAKVRKNCLYSVTIIDVNFPQNYRTFIGGNIIQSYL